MKTSAPGKAARQAGGGSEGKDAEERQEGRHVLLEKEEDGAGPG